MIFEHQSNPSGSQSDGFLLYRNQVHFPDSSDTAWIIKRGMLNVFGTRFDNGSPTGHRRHLFSLQAGEVLFGFNPLITADTIGLMVVAAEETELDPIAVSAFSDTSQQETCRGLSDWVNHVGQYITGNELAPTTPLTLEEGVFDIPPSETIRSDPKRDLCFKPLEGELFFTEFKNIPVTDQSEWFHWPHHLTLSAKGDQARIKITPLSETISDPQKIGKATNNLHKLLVNFLADQEAADKKREQSRRLQASQLEQSQTTGVLTELAAVLNPEKQFKTRESELLTILTVIGDQLGVEILPPSASDQPDQAIHLMDPIARSSGFRWREVTLTPDWWREDAGPLLAFLGEEERLPVALLPTGSGYRIVFPDGREQQLDDNHRKRLCPDASMIYRPLPRKVKNIFSFMLFTSRGQLKDFSLIILAGVAATLLGMLVPWTVGILFDTAIPDADRRMLFELALMLLVAAVAGIVFTFVQATASIRLGVRREITSQAATWDRVLQLRPAFFRSYSSGDLQSRVDAVSDINRELGVATLRPLLSGILALLNFGLLWYYSPDLAMIAFWIGLLVMVVTISTSYVVQRLSLKLIELAGVFHGMVIQMIGSVQKLKLTGSEYRAYNHWASRYIPQLKLELTIDRLSNGVALFHIALSPVATGLLFWKAADLVVGLNPASGSVMTIGTFIAFNAAFVLYLSGWSAISNTIVSIIDTLVKAKRVKPILEGEPEVGEDAADPGRLAGHIEFQKVTFRYTEEGPVILDQINMDIQPGEFVGIVGPSGSGKSTLLRLFLGFETPEVGRVLYDGKDLSGINVIAVRRQIGSVLQNGKLNAGSVYENIANNLQISHAEAWEAAADAGLAGDLEKMPMGIHTVVAEGGANLSGGQRQRLLIARALVGRPKMVFFDEATSALDNRTQAIVTAAIHRRRITRVVIAHRLSTIRDADRLYVIDKGRVVQQGTYAKLSQEPGFFSNLISRQMI